MVKLKGALYRRTKEWWKVRKARKAEEKAIYEEAFKGAKEEAIRERAFVKRRQLIERARREAMKPPVSERLGAGLRRGIVTAGKLGKEAVKKVAEAEGKPRKKAWETGILGKPRTGESYTGIRVPDLRMDFRDPFKTRKGKKQKHEIW